MTLEVVIALFPTGKQAHIHPWMLRSQSMSARHGWIVYQPLSGLSKHLLWHSHTQGMQGPPIQRPTHACM